VREWAEREGALPNTVRVWVRLGKVKARDLNAGTGKRPRYRIPASQHRPNGGR